MARDRRGPGNDRRSSSTALLEAAEAARPPSPRRRAEALTGALRLESPGGATAGQVRRGGRRGSCGPGRSHVQVEGCRHVRLRIFTGTFTDAWTTARPRDSGRGRRGPRCGGLVQQFGVGPITTTPSPTRRTDKAFRGARGKMSGGRESSSSRRGRRRGAGHLEELPPPASTRVHPGEARPPCATSVMTGSWCPDSRTRGRERRDELPTAPSLSHIAAVCQTDRSVTRCERLSQACCRSAHGRSQPPGLSAWVGSPGGRGHGDERDDASTRPRCRSAFRPTQRALRRRRSRANDLERHNDAEEPARELSHVPEPARPVPIRQVLCRARRARLPWNRASRTR